MIYPLKRTIVCLLAAGLVSTYVIGDIATAQTDQNLRRAAFQNSQKLAAIGEYAEAVALLEPLAEAGDLLAIYSIGVLYANGGDGLPQDYAKALEYYRKAADKRDAGSMRQIAIAYEKGQGVPADPAQAAQWYERAANRGDALAQQVVGLKFAKGEGGLAKSVTAAYKWLTLAASGLFYDDADAKRGQTKDALKVLVAQMSPGDISTGEKLVRDFSAQ
jgi:TPR repeat protein